MADTEAPLFTNRPASLIYRIELPEIKKASELDLDVSETKISLSSLPPSSANYFLSVDLIYPCEGEKGKAKWDKNKKVLSVTIPVTKPTDKEIEDMKATRNVVEVVGDMGEIEKGVKDVKVGEELPTPPEEKKKKEKTESKREDFAVDAPIPTNNEAAEMYTKAKGKGKKQEPKEEALPKKEQTVKVEGDFTANKTFDGARRGYVFKKGKEGLGYYVDGDGKVKQNKTENTERPNGNDKYEYRQSEKTVTILIQVPGIDVDSVSADFKAFSVKVNFKVKGKDHVFELENLFAEIDVSESRFDVASKNMLVILGKEKDNVWRTLVGVKGMKGGGGGGGGGGCRGFFFFLGPG